MHLGIDGKPAPPSPFDCGCNQAPGLLLVDWGSRNRPRMYIEKYRPVQRSVIKYTTDMFYGMTHVF